MAGHADFYRSLVQFYPKAFRGDFGDDLVQSFSDLLARDGPSRTWRRTAVDLAVTVPRYQLETLMNPRNTNTVLYIATAVAWVAAAISNDSLSAGFGIRVDQSWPALLDDRLQGKSPSGASEECRLCTADPLCKRKAALCVTPAMSPSWTVANASISGETTAGGRSRFAAALRQFKPKVVIFALGANDGLRGLPVAQIQDNLTAMIKLAKAAKARVLLVGMRMPPNYGPVYTHAFEQAFVIVAKQQKTALLPFLLAPIAGQREAFQADGLHPIAAMQGKILAHVYPALAPLLK